MRRNTFDCVTELFAVTQVVSSKVVKKVELSGSSTMQNKKCFLQGHYAADLYCHPQLDTDVGAVKDIYSDSAVGVRYLQ